MNLPEAERKPSSVSAPLAHRVPGRPMRDIFGTVKDRHLTINPRFLAPMSLGSMVDIYRTSCYGGFKPRFHHWGGAPHCGIWIYWVGGLMYPVFFSVSAMESTWVVSMIVSQWVQEPNYLFRIHNFYDLHIFFLYIYIIYIQYTISMIYISIYFHKYIIYIQYNIILKNLKEYIYIYFTYKHKHEPVLIDLGRIGSWESPPGSGPRRPRPRCFIPRWWRRKKRLFQWETQRKKGDQHYSPT